MQCNTQLLYVFYSVFRIAGIVCVSISSLLLIIGIALCIFVCCIMSKSTTSSTNPQSGPIFQVNQQRCNSIHFVIRQVNISVTLQRILFKKNFITLQSNKVYGPNPGAQAIPSGNPQGHFQPTLYSNFGYNSSVAPEDQTKPPNYINVSPNSYI